MLNRYSSKTKDNIHIMVTTLCDRKCKYCCNNQYDVTSIKCVTNYELSNCKNIFLTGGEPFKYSNVSAIALWYKKHYKNIEKVYVYGNALEASEYFKNGGKFDGLDGMTISIKTKADKDAFEKVDFPSGENRLYIFNSLVPNNLKNFKMFKREWQPVFVPADDSIFRRQ